MKLLQKLNRDYILSSVIVLVIGLLAFYIAINAIASSDVSEGLHASAARIIRQLEHNKSVPGLYPIIEVKRADKLNRPIMKDTLIYDPVVGEKELFKELNTWKSIHGKIYHITVRALTVEKTDIVMSIFLATAVLLLLLIGTLYFINKKTASSIWKPFYQNLEKLKSFSLQSHEKFELNETPISEFNELNQRIIKLTDKVKSDYNSLKEFTENASHELQTPLAVIQAKAENLLNSNDLKIKDANVIQSILENISRLEKLNSTLLLLTKIENSQFADQDNVRFFKIIQDNLENMKELFEMRRINTEIYVKEDFIYKMSAPLAQTMIINLLKNALVHTAETGTLDMEIDKDYLVFANTGAQIIKNSNLIFERFYKENSDEKSTGLGLSLVSKICEVSHLKIDYSYSENRHIFTIRKE